MQSLFHWDLEKYIVLFLLDTVFNSSYFFLSLLANVEFIYLFILYLMLTIYNYYYKKTTQMEIKYMVK